MKHLPRRAGAFATTTLATAAFAVLAELAPAAALAAPPAAPPAAQVPAPSAAPPCALRAAPARPRPFTAWDWAGTFLAADVGALAGGAAGVGIWAATVRGQGGQLRASPTTDAVGLVAMPTLASAGAAAGAYAYGSLRGHRGSYWAALGGSAVGSLATLGVVAATLGGVDDTDTQHWVTGVAAFTLPALGATVGYYLSREAAPRPAMGSAALLDLGRDGQLRLQLPALAVAPQRSPKRMGVAVSVPLFGGAL